MFLSHQQHMLVLSGLFEVVGPDFIHCQGDCVACEEDGIRPYSFFFCLSWFHKKEKKNEPTPQVYDVDLMKAEQEEDHLDVPIPNSRYDNSLVVTRVPNAVL
jgi:hypothetical protein